MTDFLTTAILNQTEDYQAGYRDGWEAREKVISDPEPTGIEAQKIIGSVCGYFQTDMNIITTMSRKRERVYARQICMYYLKKYSGLSLKIIGEMFGGRDHTTVIHSIETIENLIFSSAATRNDIRALNQVIVEVKELTTQHEI